VLKTPSNCVLLLCAVVNQKVSFNLYDDHDGAKKKSVKPSCIFVGPFQWKRTYFGYIHIMCMFKVFVSKTHRHGMVTLVDIRCIFLDCRGENFWIYSYERMLHNSAAITKFFHWSKFKILRVCSPVWTHHDTHCHTIVAPSTKKCYDVTSA